MIRRNLTALVAAALVALASAPAAAQAPELIDGAARAYTERGDARETIRQLGTALDAGAIPPALEPRARVYLAHAFLALGDTVSALPHIRTALNAEPCLMPAPEFTPPAWIELYRSNRPDVSCRRKGILSTLQSMIVPGWGQLSVGRVGPAGYFFASTVVAAGGAYLLNARAEDRYASYQGSADPLAVGDLFDQAERSRRFALILGGVAGGLYVWNVIDAVLGGVSHDRDLVRVRRLAIHPVVVPTATGAILAVRVPLN